MSWSLLRGLQAAQCPSGDGLSRRQVLAAALAGAGGLLSLDRSLASSKAAMPIKLVGKNEFANESVWER